MTDSKSSAASVSNGAAANNGGMRAGSVRLEIDPPDESEGVPLLDEGGFCSEEGNCLTRCWFGLGVFLCGVRARYEERIMHISGRTKPQLFVPNVVRNQKYNPITFLPVVLYEQFRFFFNLFYLMVALSQFIPVLKVGFLFTYVAPLVFVLCVTIGKEAYDDYKRYLRDREANSSKYLRLTEKGLKPIPASEIKVGHVIQIGANQRVPADFIFLRTTEKSGSTFLRTDQLDGETDWKLRRAVVVTQHLPSETDILRLDATCQAEAPRKDIYEFIGRFTVRNMAHHQPRRISHEAEDGSMYSEPNLESPDAVDGDVEAQTAVHSMASTDTHVEGLTLDNTLWSNAVVASGTCLGLCIYTGKETRAVMNASSSVTKTGLFELEVNLLSKLLFVLLISLSFLLTVCKGFEGIWPIYFFRFLLMLSSIIPISMRVNLDMAKTVYSVQIMRDPKIPDTVVRTSTIPEELGRMDYVLSDKTGTLTQNEMVFKKIHLGRAAFGEESFDEVRHALRMSFSTDDPSSPSNTSLAHSSASASASSAVGGLSLSGFGSGKRHVEVRQVLRHAITGLALCHNVTPVTDEETGEVTFQAASPDEVALVKFASLVGVKLVERDQHSITLRDPHGVCHCYEILACFPFTSESKRMGIVVRARDSPDQRILFFIKGAESVMIPRLSHRGTSWLSEECDNFARTGLRTLVLAYREISSPEFDDFNKRFAEARSAMTDRAARVRQVVDSLEINLDLLALTGVEDKLQQDVQQTLESLRHAGVRVWMLTGDKVETATCIAISAGLKSRLHSLMTLSSSELATPQQAIQALERFATGPTETVLIVDGKVLAMLLHHHEAAFIETACLAPAVVCCRCSPTQKADVVRLIKKYTGKRTCAIGDGGNDVSMIQAADVGVGIVGKEGKQASLAADFSITQFCYLRRLLLWHGRNSYQRSAKLAQFVIHRGLIIAIIQVLFSAIFFFIALPIFQGMLSVGYSTFYTMAPVFALVLDVELPESVIFMYPELYQTLRNGRVMSIKTFFGWVWKSIYQGAVIMILAILLFEEEFMNIVAITFTALILSELLNVASEVHTWHPLMITAEILTVIVYIFSMFILRTYFDIFFIMTSTFLWKCAVIVAASWGPPHVWQVVRRIVRPPQYTKLAD